MSNLILHRNTENQAIALPGPRGGDIRVRVATLDDFAFIDQLQKKHGRMVGFAPRGQLETNIKKNNVVIAENERGVPVGYCISIDKYLKQDQLGICYQLNVVPDMQRGLIGATLLKEVFNRSAYGCKLFCCWCAQDLNANLFWESMGFIPLAFRTGSRSVRHKDGTKGPRIHIFWQRRIREGDTETQYWFPSETSGGAVKENRIVLPIPPGTHWSDAKPAILPGLDEKLLDHSRAPQCGNPADGTGSPPARGRRMTNPKVPVPVMKPSSIKLGGLRSFAPKPPTAEEKAAMKAAKPKPPREKFKNDPKMVAAARELRDRYMEQVNIDPAAMLPPGANGKYEVSRQLVSGASQGEAMSVLKLEQLPLLEAA